MFKPTNYLVTAVLLLCHSIASAATTTVNFTDTIATANGDYLDHVFATTLFLEANKAKSFQSGSLPFTGAELADFDSAAFLLLTYLGDDTVLPRLPANLEILLSGSIASLKPKTVVPLPASILLLSSGLVMLAISRRRRS